MRRRRLHYGLESSGLRAAALGALALLCLLCGPASCDRGSGTKPSRKSGKPAASQISSDFVALPSHKPQYAFAAGLTDQYAPITGFLRHFLETCLAGDYAGYRRLVTRAQEPESRGRFEKMLNSMRAVTILSIEEVELPQSLPLWHSTRGGDEASNGDQSPAAGGADTPTTAAVRPGANADPAQPPPAYLVIAEADFVPGKEPVLRQRATERKVAILVLKEEGEWRIAVAPAEYQPREDEPTTTASAPAEAPPDYPWDQDGDY